MTPLWEKWKKDNNIVINNVEDILDYREHFKAYHSNEIYNETVTLCKECHMNRLHKIYGKVPKLQTAEKQKRWCEKMRTKHKEKMAKKEISSASTLTTS